VVKSGNTVVVISGGLGRVAPLGTIFPTAYATVIKQPGEGGFFKLSSEIAIYLNFCIYNFFDVFIGIASR